VDIYGYDEMAEVFVCLSAKSATLKQAEGTDPHSLLWTSLQLFKPKVAVPSLPVRASCPRPLTEACNY
jgi:hypothetical protein